MKKHLKIAFGLLLMLIMALTVFTLGADPLTGLTLCGAVPVTFADLEFTDGEDNAAGTQLLAYYILAEDIATLPGYKTDPSNLADYATIDQAFVCKAGKKFNKLYATPDSGKIDDNKIEGKDSNAYESIYEYFFPKNDKSILGFMRLSGTGKFIVIVLEADGNKRVLGIKPGVPAILASVAATSGNNSGGDKGATFQFKSWQNGAAPVYTAAIPTEIVSGESSSSSSSS